MRFAIGAVGMKHLTIAVLVAVISCDLHAAEDTEIDERSYNLGILGGFSEVVRLGVKKLALSAHSLAPAFAQPSVPTQSQQS